MKNSAILDPIGVSSRIEELKLLRFGWLDGRGVPPASDGLCWLSEAFEKHYPAELPLPYLFPTPEGQVLAEWPLKPWSGSLEIDLAEKRGEWHALNLATDAEEEKQLQLTESNDWQWLAEQIRSLNGEVE